MTVSQLAPAAGPTRRFDPDTELSRAEARALTDQIRGRVTGLLELIAEAFNRRADVALGYASWDRYCFAEFPAIRWRATEEREHDVARLKQAGMSNRAIGDALGMDESTVRKDLGRGATRVPSAGFPADDSPARSLDGRRVGERGGDRCKPIAVNVRITTSPLHFARQAAAIVAAIDAEGYLPGDLDAEQIRVTMRLRAALSEFATVMQEREIAKEDQP